MAQKDKPSLQLPVAIFRNARGAHRYMLYDIDVISWVRKEHRIGGVFMGSLPQVPQQNVFLGLPLQLMPEEARLLVDDGIAYIVDDTESHVKSVNSATTDDLHRYLEQLQLEGQNAAKENAQRRMEMRLKSQQKRKTAMQINENEMGVKEESTPSASTAEVTMNPEPGETSQSHLPSNAELEVWPVTPTTSTALIPNPSPSKWAIPQVDASSYALFRHLHTEGYFLSPGLRFGCQFTAYPGDSLRFHSHFLCVAFEWDEEMSLVDLLAGGRLGTGVKKGYLLGGSSPDNKPSNQNVRTFSVEWAGM